MPDPARSLASHRVVVFDTETTGLAAGVDRVLEIAALALENGVETGRFESLIDPGVPIPPDLTAIHGITDEMVRGSPPFAEVARRFLDFLADSILAGHNAPYDISMLIVPMIESGLSPRGNPVIDTCRLARRLLPAPNYRLGTLAQILGAPMSKAHRAMVDVEACAVVLSACLARLGAAATLRDVESASRTRIAFGPAGSIPHPLPPRLAPLEEAMRDGRSVRIVYRGGSHGEAPRPILPLFLLELDGSLNVSALCQIERTLKNFRIDRIAKVTAESP